MFAPRWQDAIAAGSAGPVSSQSISSRRLRARLPMQFLLPRIHHNHLLYHRVQRAPAARANTALNPRRYTGSWRNYPHEKNVSKLTYSSSVSTINSQSKNIEPDLSNFSLSTWVNKHPAAVSPIIWRLTIYQFLLIHGHHKSTLFVYRSVGWFVIVFHQRQNKVHDDRMIAYIDPKCWRRVEIRFQLKRWLEPHWQMTKGQKEQQ